MRILSSPTFLFVAALAFSCTAPSFADSCQSIFASYEKPYEPGFYSHLVTSLEGHRYHFSNPSTSFNEKTSKRALKLLDSGKTLSQMTLVNKTLDLISEIQKATKVKPTHPRLSLAEATLLVEAILEPTEANVKAVLALREQSDYPQEKGISFEALMLSDPKIVVKAVREAFKIEDRTDYLALLAVHGEQSALDLLLAKAQESVKLIDGKVNEVARRALLDILNWASVPLERSTLDITGWHKFLTGSLDAWFSNPYGIGNSDHFKSVMRDMLHALGNLAIVAGHEQSLVYLCQILGKPYPSSLGHGREAQMASDRAFAQEQTLHQFYATRHWHSSVGPDLLKLTSNPYIYGYEAMWGAQRLGKEIDLDRPRHVR